MSVDTTNAQVEPVNHSDVVAKISWKMPITYAIATVITLFFALNAQGEAVFRLTLNRSDRFQIPPWHVDSAMLCWILAAITALVLAYSVYRAMGHKSSGVARQFSLV